MNRSRITGDLVSQNNIFVNTANDRVGIGSTIPTNKLDVRGVIESRSATNFHESIWTGNTTKIQLQAGYLHIQGGSNGTVFRTLAGGNCFHVTSSGHLAVQLDSTFDIGTNSSRVRNIYADTLYGDGANLTNTGSSLSEPSSGTQRLVTTSLTSGTMTSSGTGSELAFDYANNHLEFLDSVKATFGTGGDLELYHDGSHSYIHDGGTGNLKVRSNNFRVSNADESKLSATFQPAGAVELYHNNSKKLETTSTSVTLSDNLVMGNHSIELNDNSQIMLGNAPDMRIYHDGSHSYITNTTGDLTIVDESRIKLRTDQFVLNNHANNESIIYAAADGEVSLYHNGNKKFDTTGNGIDVTGTVTADNQIVLNSSDSTPARIDLYCEVSNAHYTRLQAPAHSTYSGNVTVTIPNTSGNLAVLANAADNRVVTATGTHGMTGESDLTFDGTNLDLPDDHKIRLGSSQDFQIYHDPNTNVIYGTAPISIQTNDTTSGISFVSTGGHETIAKFVKDGDCTLFRDNSPRIKTTAGGIEVSNNLGLNTGIGEAIKINTSPTNTNDGSKISFARSNTVYSEIVTQKMDGSNNTDMYFKTGTSPTERLRLTSNGNLGVAGATGTDFSLLDGMVINTANGSAGVLINSSSSSHNAYLGFSYGSGSSTSHADQFSAYIGRVGDNNLILGTNNSIRVQVTSSGHVVPGADSTYDLGLTGTRWRNLYADTLYGNGSNLTALNIVTDTSPQLGGTLDVNGQAISFPDSNGTTNQARFGTGDDLKIYHQSNSSYIINSTGNLNIGSNNRVRIRGGSDVAENMAVFNDNGSVELYHDNYKNLEVIEDGLWLDNDAAQMTIYLASNGTTRGYIFAESDIGFKTAANEWAVQISNNADVSLFYDGSKKFETTSWGNQTTGGLAVNATSTVTGSYFHYKYGATGASNAGERHLSVTGNEAAIEVLATDGGDHAGSLILRGNNDGYAFINSCDNNRLEIVSFAAAGGDWSVHGNGNNVSRKDFCIVANQDAGVELYSDNSKKAETFGSGFKVSGGGELYIDGNAANGHCQLVMTRSDVSYMIANETFLRFYTQSGNQSSPNGLMAEFTNSGHFRPGANNTYDLGTSGRAWRNLYVNDAHFSNKGHSNDVDGTWGDWTLQEGENDIFMINNRTGKKFAITMREVS